MAVLNINIIMVVACIWSMCRGAEDFKLCYEDNCYHKSFLTMDWVKASVYCMKMNALLVSIHSSEENALMHFLCNSESSCWTGMNDIDNEGVMQWLDGTKIDYANFGPAEPNNNGGDENFVHITTEGMWNDQDWYVKYYALCKRPRDNHCEAPRDDHRRIVYSQKERNEEFIADRAFAKSDMPKRQVRSNDTVTVTPEATEGY